MLGGKDTARPIQVRRLLQFQHHPRRKRPNLRQRIRRRQGLRRRPRLQNQWLRMPQRRITLGPIQSRLRTGRTRAIPRISRRLRHRNFRQPLNPQRPSRAQNKATYLRPRCRRHSSQASRPWRWICPPKARRRRFRLSPARRRQASPQRFLPAHIWKMATFSVIGINLSGAIFG